MKLRIAIAGMTIVALVSLGMNVWLVTVIQNLKIRPVSVESDEPYVRRAAIFWGAKNGTTAVNAMNGRYGKVVYFSGQACVSLEVEAGGVGGVPVYCFDEHNGQLTGRYDDVE